MIKFQNFTIQISKKVYKELKSIPHESSAEIIKKIDQLKDDATFLDIKKLTGYRNLYRMRCGDYRIVFKIDHTILTIQVILIAHRKEVYLLLKSLVKSP